MHATTLLPPSTLSEHDPFGERRGAIYLPDGLAAKLLSVCDAAAGLEPSEPNSQIHSDLDDLWSSILASPASPIDSSNTKAEEAIQRFAERYGLVHCFPSGNLSWLDKTGNTKPASADLYKDLLEAAFGKQSGGSVYEREYRDNTLKIAISYPNFNEETEGPVEWSPQVTRSSSPSLDLSDTNAYCETPRFYYNRPHTPQVIRVNLSRRNNHDFWAIPNLMKKPTLFPPTPRNIKDWIFWRRIHR